MTEILLEVTSQETESVAKEVFYKARNNAAKGILSLAQSVCMSSNQCKQPYYLLYLVHLPGMFYHRHFRWKEILSVHKNIFVTAQVAVKNNDYSLFSVNLNKVILLFQLFISLCKLCFELYCNVFSKQKKYYNTVQTFSWTITKETTTCVLYFAINS